MSASDLERAWIFLLKAHKLPPMTPEYRFHPERKWRMDFVYEDLKIAVELEGGTYIQGRHQRPEGFAADCEKYSEAAILGWCVLRFTKEQVEDGLAIETLQRALHVRQPASEREKCEPCPTCESTWEGMHWTGASTWDGDKLYQGGECPFSSGGRVGVET